jgi:hypothetical protein
MRGPTVSSSRQFSSAHGVHVGEASRSRLAPIPCLPLPRDLAESTILPFRRASIRTLGSLLLRLVHVEVRQSGSAI